MGYVHRDIKPENIVLQFVTISLTQGVPKICDFGWATTCSGNTCKSYCGTPLYISPEMIRKEKYGTSVDLWAMGLVVYELLVGRGPFRIWSE
jgi:serine/threonine protein kinase